MDMLPKDIVDVIILCIKKIDRESRTLAKQFEW